MFLFVLKVRKIKNIKLGGERTWIWEEWGREKCDQNTLHEKIKSKNYEIEDKISD